MPRLSEGRVALGALIVFALWLFVGLPLLLSPREVSLKQEIHSAQPSQQPDAEPKGSHTAPFFVEVVPAPKSAEQDAQEREDRQEKKSADRWLVRWTAALFAATVGLILATGVLGYFAYRQAELTRRAVELGNREFIASHRPALRIRNVVVTPPTGPDNPIFVAGHKVTGQLSIENVGGSRADILDGYCTVFWSDHGLPMQRPYEGEAGNLRPAETSLLSGQSTTAPFASTTTIEQRVAQTAGRPIAAGYRLWVMGWISYADRNNDVWRTAFCREYKFRDGFGDARFYPVDDPDYEHGAD